MNFLANPVRLLKFEIFKNSEKHKEVIIHN